jgi:hypothetical protein
MSDSDYTPLSCRRVSELRAQAEEYRRLANAARTIDVVGALLRLADQFEALAAEREDPSRGAPDL